MPGYDFTKRFAGLPCIAAGTDIPAGAPVQFVSLGAVPGVRPVENNSTEIVGISRASAANGEPVDLIDMPDVKIAVAAASIAQGAFIGVASANPTTGASGNFPVPQIAEVARASAANRWALGVALEGAAKGNEFRYYFKPRQLSGLI